MIRCNIRQFSPRLNALILVILPRLLFQLQSLLKYKKHRKDIFRLLTILNTDSSPIEDVPEMIKEKANEFLPVLESAKDLAKEYSVKLETVVNLYKKIFRL